MKQVLTPAQAAEYLGVTPGTLANWRSTKIGPPFSKINKKCVRYLRDQLDKWVREQQGASTDAKRQSEG